MHDFMAWNQKNGSENAEMDERREPDVYTSSVHDKPVHVRYLSGEVDVKRHQVVQFCEDLPEDLVVHLSSLPGIKFGSNRGVKGHVTDH